MMNAALMLFFVGCTLEEVTTYTVVSQEEQNNRETDTAYLIETETTEAPSIADIETILQQGIEEVRTVRVGRLLDVYDEMLAQMDSECPRWFANSYGAYWADTCTSNTGVSFEGFASSTPRNDTEPGPYGNVFSGRQIHCEGILSQADTTLQCTGGINELVGVDSNGHDVFYSYSRPYVLIEGTDTVYFPDVEMWAVNAPTYKAIYYNGVQLVRDGEQIIGAVEFGEQTFNNVGCLTEPNGTQHIQVDGEWVYVEWHGDALPEDATCDGCGDAYFGGEPIGKVCANVATWLDWEASPFE